MSVDLPDHADSKAILVGVSSYLDPAFTALPAAANSLLNMQALLADTTLCGWPSSSIEMRHNPANTGHFAHQLWRIAEQARGVLLLYFVGHGTISRRGRLCLSLTDTDAAGPEFTGLEYTKLRDILLDSPAQTKVVILDCCYSGRAIEALAGQEDYFADSTETRGVYTLTAADRVAHVVPLDQQRDACTTFTAELVELVRTGIPGGPRLLTLNLLYWHLAHRLVTRNLPRPNQRGTDTADRFPFARNAAFASAGPARNVAVTDAGPARNAAFTDAGPAGRADPPRQHAALEQATRPPRRLVTPDQSTTLSDFRPAPMRDHPSPTHHPPTPRNSPAASSPYSPPSPLPNPAPAQAEGFSQLSLDRAARAMAAMTREGAAAALTELDVTRVTSLLNRVQPRQAAEVLERMTVDQAAFFLGQLDVDQVGLVLLGMDADRAFTALDRMDVGRAASVLNRVVPQQAAGILDAMGDDKACAVLSRMNPHEAGDVLDLMDEDRAVYTLEQMRPRRAAAVLRETSSYHVVTLIEQMDAVPAARVLARMDPARADLVLDQMDQTCAARIRVRMRRD